MCISETLYHSSGNKISRARYRQHRPFTQHNRRNSTENMIIVIISELISILNNIALNGQVSLITHWLHEVYLFAVATYRNVRLCSRRSATFPVRERKWAKLNHFLSHNNGSPMLSPYTCGVHHPLETVYSSNMWNDVLDEVWSTGAGRMNGNTKWMENLYNIIENVILYFVFPHFSHSFSAKAIKSWFDANWLPMQSDTILWVLHGRKLSWRKSNKQKFVCFSQDKCSFVSYEWLMILSVEI